MGTKRSFIFAIDFDGTIVEHKFPEIGKLKSGAIRVMHRLQEAGHRLILWTCRANNEERNYLAEAKAFCRSNGLTFDTINVNINPLEVLGIPKVLADFYLDDKSFPPFMGWHDFEVLMEEMGIL